MTLLNTALNKALLSITLLLPLVACNDKDSDKKSPPDKQYSITSSIEWTSYGVPHITGDNYREVGAGLGYVMAQDKLCNYLDGIATARGERAKYLGAGQGDQNIHSDFVYRHLATYSEAQTAFAQQDSRIQDLLKGFARGFNFWMTQHPNNRQGCADLAQEIDHIDLLAQNLSLRYWPFISDYLLEIATAQPNVTQPKALLLNKQHSMVDKMKGSNGWALGKAITQSGKGMLLSNTHLPHYGQYAWYEAQLTIPGKLNVYGGFLPGFMTPALGFNKTFAWTHTWTASTPGSIYVLDTAENNPLAYQYGAEIRELQATTYEIEVKQADGGLTTQSRTLYKSHQGPVMLFDEEGSIYVAKDGSSLLNNQLEYWLKLALSNSVDEAVALNEQGYRTGSQNIMMADSAGQVFYADMAAVPNLSDAAWSVIESVPELRAANGVMLDGSSSLFEWSELVPFEQLPKRQRDDYVQNANDTAWLANMDAPLTGYSPLYGRTDLPQSPRTQLSVSLLEALKKQSEKVTLADLQQVMANKTLYLADLTVNDLVARCTAYPNISISRVEIDLTPACNVLRNWDKTANGDSVGAHIFREYAANLEQLKQQVGCAPTCWQTPFDPQFPLTTPAGLPEVVEPDTDIHLLALAGASDNLSRSEVGLNVPLASIQQLVKGSQSYPLAGGYGDLTGSFATVAVNTGLPANYLSDTGLTEQGYNIEMGDGFVFLMAFTEQGITAKSVLYYSQSNSPDSAHYFDQAPLIEQAEYKDVKFTSNEIKADSNYRLFELKIE